MAFSGNFQNRQEIKGITLIISACDVRGWQRPCLNILLNHSPNGLELYAHAKMLSLEERSLFYARVILWQFKVDRLQILYDCNNRILLYAATLVTGCQLSAAPDILLFASIASFYWSILSKNIALDQSGNGNLRSYCNKRVQTMGLTSYETIYFLSYTYADWSKAMT